MMYPIFNLHNKFRFWAARLVPQKTNSSTWKPSVTKTETRSNNLPNQLSDVVSWRMTGFISGWRMSGWTPHRFRTWSTRGLRSFNHQRTELQELTAEAGIRLLLEDWLCDAFELNWDFPLSETAAVWPGDHNRKLLAWTWILNTFQRSFLLVSISFVILGADWQPSHCLNRTRT